VFAKKKGLSRKAGPPVHDDLAKRRFTVDAPEAVWVTEITEHWTAWIPRVVATPKWWWRCLNQVRHGAEDQFFDLLDRGGSVRAAARAVGVHEAAAYSWSRGMKWHCDDQIDFTLLQKNVLPATLANPFRVDVTDRELNRTDLPSPSTPTTTRTPRLQVVLVLRVKVR
jgi:hypothetical protein